MGFLREKLFELIFAIAKEIYFSILVENISTFYY
jgi:hypothetical protein